MSIRFRCPDCNATLSIASKSAGKEITCPKCRRPVVVPKPEKKPKPGILIEENEDPAQKDWRTEPPPARSRMPSPPPPSTSSLPIPTPTCPTASPSPASSSLPPPPPLPLPEDNSTRGKGGYVDDDNDDYRPRRRRQRQDNSADDQDDADYRSRRQRQRRNKWRSSYWIVGSVAVFVVVVAAIVLFENSRGVIPGLAKEYMLGETFRLGDHEITSEIYGHSSHIAITHRNLNPNKPLSIGSQASSYARDDIGNEYRFKGGFVWIRHSETLRLNAGQSVQEDFDFEPVTPGAKVLYVFFDASQWGGSGWIKIKVPNPNAPRSR